MKYSLKDKQFKKRNHIFGERKQYYPEDNQLCLNQIKQLPHQSEESEYQIQKYKTIVQHFQDLSNVNRQGQHLTKQNKNYKIDQEFKYSKHGLLPNIKPTLPIITMMPIQRQFPANKPKNLSIQSHVVQIHYSNFTRDNTIEQLKQYICKLYKIMIVNNQKINLLQTAAYTLFHQNKYIINFVNSNLHQTTKLDRKIDVFINTMRNVYEELRISRLKQQNLELYFRQARNEIVSQNKNVVKGCWKEPVLNEFIQLLQYQSDKNSFDSESIYSNRLQNRSKLRQNSQIKKIQPYKNKDLSQHRNINYYNINSHIKNKQQDTHNIQNTNNYVQNPIKSQRNNYQISVESDYDYFGQFNQSKNEKLRQRLSPFEANNQINTNQQNHKYQPDHINQQKTFLNVNWPKPHLRQQSIQKTVCYNDKILDYNRIKRALERNRQIGLRSWVDQMGCIRRANSTYIFDENGEVVKINKKLFSKLLQQGYVRPMI